MSTQVLPYGAPHHWTPQVHHQHHHQHHLTHTTPAIPVTIAPSTHASVPSQSTLIRAGIWSEAEDQQLVKARGLSQGWNAIANQYFPGKSGNACRKRHERLMKKSGGGNDQMRLDMVAKQYVQLREYIWGQLAERVGMTWNEVEKLVSTVSHDFHLVSCY
jgi:hypothetical protein